MAVVSPFGTALLYHARKVLENVYSMAGRGWRWETGLLSLFLSEPAIELPSSVC